MTYNEMQCHVEGKYAGDWFLVAFLRVPLDTIVGHFGDGAPVGKGYPSPSQLGTMTI